jgi:hypothetical protein
MEYDQRMIIKFRLNERINAHEITRRFQAEFDEQDYAFRTVQFWIKEVRLGR